MWIERLTLKDFRGFAELDLDLDRPVTVLVGVNGSGKSSVLRAIHAIQPVVHQRWADLIFPVAIPLDTRDLRVGAVRGEVVVQVHAAHDGTVRLSWDREEIGWWWDEQSWGLLPHPSARPFLFMAGTDRYVETASVRAARGSEFTVPNTDNGDEDTGSAAPRPGYARFIEWFKGREDVENARRVASRDLDLQDPQLRAVREAVAALMPGFDGLRIDRETSPAAMVVTKGGVVLRLDQLSDGERNLVALAGDLARRLAITRPDSDAPRTIEGVVLIDEVEQHLHPAIQRKVMPALRRAFPGLQFIVTTHSPQVVASVPADAVIALKHFTGLRLSHPTEGRDSNAILREVFGDPGRPPEAATEIEAVRALIEAEQFDEARARLATLAARFSEQDDDVLTLRTRLDFAEVGL